MPTQLELVVEGGMWDLLFPHAVINILALPTQYARYDCVVHWAKLEKPRSKEEAEDTRARLQRRCVRKIRGFVPNVLYTPVIGFRVTWVLRDLRFVGGAG